VVTKKLQGDEKLKNQFYKDTLHITHQGGSTMDE
jgi:hypothetical protein